MTTFKPQVWSDDDPDYAPLHRLPFQRLSALEMPPRYIAAGFSLKEVPLRRGFIDDGHHQERALEVPGTHARTPALVGRAPEQPPGSALDQGLIARATCRTSSPRSRASRATRRRHTDRTVPIGRTRPATCSSQTWTS